MYSCLRKPIFNLFNSLNIHCLWVINVLGFIWLLNQKCHWDPYKDLVKAGAVDSFTALF